ncbi:MAG: response regulator [Chloroflexi bacterium]|nr:response regulator [Chloroflexota bacterium]
MPYKVLVVDDDPSFLELMQTLLNSEGYRVLTCSHSQDVPDTIHRERPDVVTLDLRMPDMSGWQILDALKQHPETMRIPVIVVSAAGTELSETRARLSHYEGRNVSSLVKPFEIDELLSRIADAIPSVSAERRDSSSAA